MTAHYALMTRTPSLGLARVRVSGQITNYTRVIHHFCVINTKN